MELYLVRHGEAKSETEDARRPLNERGRREVESVARAAAAKGITVLEILQSDKLRAGETAEILARHLFPAGGVRRTQGLGPEDDPFIAKVELEAAAHSLMLVGHLPHLGRLASLLLTGNPDSVVVGFSTATIACLARERGRWRMRWTLSP